MVTQVNSESCKLKVDHR